MYKFKALLSSDKLDLYTVFTHRKQQFLSRYINCFDNAFKVIDNVSLSYLNPSVVNLHRHNLIKNINSLQPGVGFLYPLETSENLRVF